MPGLLITELGWLKITEIKEFFDDSGKILGLCRGQVVDIDEDETEGSVLCRVTYEDGYSEDLNETECRPVIDLQLYVKKINSGEVNEWEMGNMHRWG